MVSARRLERLTDRLEGDCSIQLSYADITHLQKRLYNKKVAISSLFFKNATFINIYLRLSIISLISSLLLKPIKSDTCLPSL